jgi:parallel beta-helix repeat protein
MSLACGRILVVSALLLHGCVAAWDPADSGAAAPDAMSETVNQPAEMGNSDEPDTGATETDVDQDATPPDSGTTGDLHRCDAGTACGDASAVLDAGALDATQPQAQADAAAACQVCDPKATCSLSADQAHCTCPPDTQDLNSDGRMCKDRCALAGCAADATCHLEQAKAKCSCNAGFSGDGTTCTRDPTCAALGCASVATCQTVTGSLRCVCPQGFQGSGVGTTGCSCAPDYTLDSNSWCVHERTANCVNHAPPHATATVAPVTLTYSSASGWSTPADCAWSCQTNYASENGECINTKAAPCANQAPQNATSTPAQVAITYTSAGGWSAPAACAWTCSGTFVRSGNTCVAAPCQLSSPSADAYVDPVNGVDDMLHGNGKAGCAFRSVGYALLLADAKVYLAGGTHPITQVLQVASGQQLLCDAASPATLDGQPKIIGGDNGFIALFASGSSMKNCIAQGRATGICITTDGAVTLQNNKVSNCGGAAVSAKGDGLIFTGNTIVNNNTNVFFQVGGSATISGNSFSASSEDVGCNVLTTISGNGNTHPGGVVTCRTPCGCPSGF